MKKYPLLISLFVSYLAISFSSFAATEVKQLAQGDPKSATTAILLLGDSISASYGMEPDQGWVNLLNKKLLQAERPFSIINASVSGETTSGGLARLPSILAHEKVDHLLIELGGNDGLRGYSPKLIKNNLLQMIKLAQAKNIKVSMIKIKITPNYGPRYNKMFEQLFDDLAKETDITLLPFFMEQVATSAHLMQADGIHPNAKAQTIIADYVEQQLLALMSTK